MRTKHWIFVFVSLLLAAVLAHLILTCFNRAGVTATIYQHGTPIETINLGRVGDPYTIVVMGEDGAENVVLVERGQISVYSASCPDQICVRQGPITDGTVPIVCLPHRLVIQITQSPDDFDSVVGG